MEQSKAQRKEAFLRVARENKANQDRHSRLISEYFRGDNEVLAESLRNFLETKKVDSIPFLVLVEYAEAYYFERAGISPDTGAG